MKYDIVRNLLFWVERLVVLGGAISDVGDTKLNELLPEPGIILKNSLDPR